MTRRRPTVFELDEVEFEGELEGDPAGPAAEANADSVAPLAADKAPTVTEPARERPRRFRWVTLFASGALGLTLLGLSVSVWVFVEDLFGRTPFLGTLALLLAIAALAGLVGMTLKEWIAIRRLKTIEALRASADEAAQSDDRDKAKAVLDELATLYADRPQLARSRKAMRAHMREVIDGRDLLGLGEREILAALDREAIREIVGASRRVAAVTALSPRALVDVGYVIFAALSLVRRIAVIYGGRPGTLGFVRVLRHAIAHLAVTGGMAAGDTLVGEVIGKGIAAKLSARLGEGIVNGLMTARLGLAALDVLRPLPFVGTRRPRVNDVIAEIARIAPKEKPPA